jgi:hypothetical protein
MACKLPRAAQQSATYVNLKVVVAQTFVSDIQFGLLTAGGIELCTVLENSVVVSSTCIGKV